MRVKQHVEPIVQKSHDVLPPVVKKAENIIGTLVDIDSDSDDPLFQRSISSDTRQEEFNSSTDSNRNLLDDNLNSNGVGLIKPTPVTISRKTPLSSSSKTFSQ